MTNRKNQESRRRRRRTNRTAQRKDGDQIYVVHHGSSKGYDVEMIRDFLENLLLELRAHHYKNLAGLKIMEKYGDARILCKADNKVVPPALVEQFEKYWERYETQLLFTDEIDGDNATQAENDMVVEALLRLGTEERDKQIGHLEALQKLFDEALTCATVPFGVSSDGCPCYPTRVFRVREWIDQQDQDDASLPTRHVSDNAC